MKNTGLMMFCEIMALYFAGHTKNLYGQNSVFKYQSFLLPTDAQENCFSKSIKIYIKITTAPTCFGAITITRERTV